MGEMGAVRLFLIVPSLRDFTIKNKLRNYFTFDSLSLSFPIGGRNTIYFRLRSIYSIPIFLTLLKYLYIILLVSIVGFEVS